MAERIQNKKLHLTYSTHINFDNWLKWINETVKCPVSQYSWVHETGETGHLHTHILIELKNQLITRNMRFFDYEGIHPNITKVIKRQHWEKIINQYHSKEVGSPNGSNINKLVNTSVIGTCVPKNNVKSDPAPGVDELWQCESASQAAKIYANGKGGIYRVSSIISAFKLKPLSYGPEPKISWLPWQQELFDEVILPCKDNRSIIWYVDLEGCGGKTSFAKHMGMYRNAFVSTNCNIYHVATQLAEMNQNGNPVDLVIINIARTDEIPNHIYTGLEQLKDGMVTAQKYVGKTLFFNSPHVVVFSNQEPKKYIEYPVKKKEYDKLLKRMEVVVSIETRPTLSEDKWDIRYLDSDTKTVIKRDYNPKPVIKLEEGTYVPGSIVPVAKPDKLLTPDEWLDENLSTR